MDEKTLAFAAAEVETQVEEYGEDAVNILAMVLGRMCHKHKADLDRAINLVRLTHKNVERCTEIFDGGN